MKNTTTNTDSVATTNTTVTTEKKEKKMTKAEKAAAKKAAKLAETLSTVNTIDYLMTTFPSTNLLNIENNQANHGRKICFRENGGKGLLLAELWIKGDQIDICAKHTMMDLLSVVLTMTDPIIHLPSPEYHESWAMKYCFRGTREEMLSLATLIYVFCAYPLSMLPDRTAQAEKSAPAEAAPAEPAPKKGKGGRKGQSKKS